MFYYCRSLEELPELPATILYDECYKLMFSYCPNIELSPTQNHQYQTPYRIPSDWFWIDAYDSLLWMFEETWGPFTSTPNINTTYYTSNTVVWASEWGIGDYGRIEF